MKVHTISKTSYRSVIRWQIVPLLSAGFACLIAAGLEAQSIRGRLLHEVTRAPVSGAYIVLLAGDSTEVTRALTDPLGQFMIHAPRAGTYRVRTERIGYRSIVSSFFELTETEVGRLELTVEPVVLTLDMLTVEGADECLVIGDQAIQVLTVWEEARKALAAVAWTGPGDRLIHELERFERWYTPNFRMVHEIRDTTPTHNVMPFLSRTVEELEQTGYVIVEEDSVIYEAPDAHVFFSTPFLQHHCFRLDQARRRGRPMFGLRFEPIPGRSTPDVKGVFWIDSET
ncbi:MAG: carboxypeptidase regulatory-like domain-containing protein, partial [Gemmatimonadota bacterium]